MPVTIPRLTVLFVLAILALALFQYDAAASEALPTRTHAVEETSLWSQIWNSTIGAVSRMQVKLHRELASLSRKLETAESPGPFLALALAAFLYGVFHAAGPGHGKVVISSYLFATNTRLSRGVLLSACSSFVQGLSAIALVSLLVLLMHQSGLQATARVRYLEIVSYGLITGLGLWMLVGTWKGRVCSHEHGHGHTQGNHSHHGNTMAERDNRMRFLALVASVGIRPCSGAIIILLFTLSQGLLLAGIGATLAMSIGTAVTVSALAVFSVLSRKAALRIANGDSVWHSRLHRGLSFAGSFAVTLFGAMLLMAAINQGQMGLTG